MRAIVIAAACLVGCYSPHYGDCEVTCASNVCPSGLECREGMCRAAGMTGACSQQVQPDAKPTGPIPLDQIVSEQVNALCSWMVRCGQYEDVTTCRAIFGSQIDVSNLLQGVAAGKVRYDGAKARECVDSFAQSTCERANALSNRVISPACTETFSGTIMGGDTCYFDEECISQVCNIGNCPVGVACCAGTCAAGAAPGRPTIGQSCAQKDRCVDSYCNVQMPPAVCTAYKSSGALCTSSEQCMLGLACVSSGSSQTCQALTPTLGACTSTNNCAQLADTCRGGTCQTGGLTGTTCANFSECQQQHPCDPSTGKCTVLSGVGESCKGYPQCRDGYCDANGFCVAKTPNGGTCDAATGGSRCESDYCDFATNQCAEQPVCI